MIEKIIAYNKEELEKKLILTEAKRLYKGKIISEVQWNEIKATYKTNLYSPSIIMRILLLISSIIGLITIMGPLFLFFNAIGIDIFSAASQKITLIITGLIFLRVTEYVPIKKGHYKSGITEAGIYIGLSLLAIGIFGFDDDNNLGYTIFALIAFSITAIRYLYVLSVVGAMLSLGNLVYIILADGLNAMSLLPIVLMLVYAASYVYSEKLHKLFPQLIFEDLFVVLKSTCLILFYTAGNYFVVRELSIELMGLELKNSEEIPLALLFYILTALLPLAYIYWGVKKKSLLFIRVGIIILAASAITFKYYFSLNQPEVSLTIIGAVLIGVSLLAFNYLKKSPYGFTGEKLIQDKWSSPNMTALVAAYTLGGTAIKTEELSNTEFGGGDFGGGGAGSSY